MDLIRRYDALKVAHDALKVAHYELMEQYDALKVAHDALKVAHYELMEQYDALKVAHDALKVAHYELMEQYDALKVAHDALKVAHDALKVAHDDLLSRNHVSQQTFRRLSTRQVLYRMQSMIVHLAVGVDISRKDYPIVVLLQGKYECSLPKVMGILKDAGLMEEEDHDVRGKIVEIGQMISELNYGYHLHELAHAKSDVQKLQTIQDIREMVSGASFDAKDEEYVHIFGIAYLELAKMMDH